jgi:hypothetical protein
MIGTQRSCNPTDPAASTPCVEALDPQSTPESPERRSIAWWHSADLTGAALGSSDRPFQPEQQGDAFIA